MQSIRTALFAMTAALAAGVAHAELTTPAIFGPHMVIQQKALAPVWGRADAGAVVKLDIAGQSVSTTAGSDGKWRVDLQPIHSTGPHTLTIVAGNDRLVYDDVLAGEVWLCSGQSNMDLRLRSADNAEKEIAAASHPNLRLFYVQRQGSDQPMDDVKGKWAACTPEEAKSFSAVAYFFGRQIMQETGAAVGLIHSAYGGSRGEAWISEPALLAQPTIAPLLKAWSQRVQRAKEAGASLASIAPQRYQPAALYNGMIHPLVPFAIRGVTWYQGESNTWRSAEYHALLTTLIADWRSRFGNDALPVGVVQLPNYALPPRVPPAPISWEELREAQLLAAKETPKVGLAVTIDIGNPLDVHPTNKQEVGRRLALWAMAQVYGREIVYSGPIVRDSRIDGKRIILTFDHIGSGLATRDGGKPAGFAIAGEDGKFRWASDVHIQDDTLVVSDEKIERPVSVRYAWDANPTWANLINREGLPASPFRTDQWPSTTAPSTDAGE